METQNLSCGWHPRFNIFLDPDLPTLPLKTTDGEWTLYNTNVHRMEFSHARSYPLAGLLVMQV
jgi:hypothetical protein